MQVHRSNHRETVEHSGELHIQSDRPESKFGTVVRKKGGTGVVRVSMVSGNSLRDSQTSFRDLKATGVEYVDGPTGQRTIAKASRLVVLSAGAFGSPTILQR